MTLTDRMIIEDYRANRERFGRLDGIVAERLGALLDRIGVKHLPVEHRVKSEGSLRGKLTRAEGAYHAFRDLTDILGTRIICYFEDEVDVIGREVEKDFVIDWDNCIDKRKTMAVDAFGYLSLHYVCSLPVSDEWPRELCELKFEVQIRTILQHAWSVIEHDLGYKTTFGVPRDIIRSFSRIAGLLELADDEFVRIRDSVNEYTENIRAMIERGEADDLPVNMVTLSEFVRHNKDMRALLDDVAAICGSEIEQTEPLGYPEQLAHLGITTVGQLSDTLKRAAGLAVRLARISLEGSELDILSSGVGLRFLCRAVLLLDGYGEEQMIAFFALSTTDRARAARRARTLLHSYEVIRREEEKP